MHHNTDTAIMGGAAAFMYGVRRHQARRAAYVQAVQEGRERDALNRRIRALEAALADRQRQVEAAEVDRRLAYFLQFKG